MSWTRTRTREKTTGLGLGLGLVQFGWTRTCTRTWKQWTRTWTRTRQLPDLLQVCF